MFRDVSVKRCPLFFSSFVDNLYFEWNEPLEQRPHLHSQEGESGWVEFQLGQIWVEIWSHFSLSGLGNLTKVYTFRFLAHRMQWMMLSCKLCNWRPIEVYVRCSDPRHWMNTEWLPTLEVQPEMTFRIWKQGNLNPRWQGIFNLSWHLLNFTDSNVGAEQRFWGLETMMLMKFCSSTHHIYFYRVLTQISSRQRIERCNNIKVGAVIDMIKDVCLM